jgi:cytochrome c biogenesis protein CcmG, thiol:disulfide interchange protein DsbE
MKRDRAIVLGGLLLLFALVSFVANRLSQPSAGHLIPIAQRHPMPAITLTDTNNNPWSILEHRSKVILINYWATWCAPCQQETPGLVQLSSEIAPSDLALIGVSLDAGGATPANQTKVAAFATRFHVKYPIAFAPNGSQFEYGLDGIPTSILIDRHGLIAKVYEGAVRKAVFKADIQSLLAEQ